MTEQHKDQVVTEKAKPDVQQLPSTVRLVEQECESGQQLPSILVTKGMIEEQQQLLSTGNGHVEVNRVTGSIIELGLQ